LHIHDTDFVLHCFGMPRRVHSSGHSSISGAVDHVVTQYEYPGGPVVYAEGGWTMATGFGFSMAYTVNFERATVDYDVARGAESLKLFAPEQSPRVVTCEGPDGYVGELGHLIESIREGKPPHIVTAQDGLNAVRICAAEERSVKEGRPVDVAD
jgi:predicted dehydrogenase